LLALTAVAGRAWGQTADTLRGRVLTDSGVAISGATVIATRAPDRAFKSAPTDSEGHYEIIFEQGTGDYLLHASAVGRTTQRKRVRRSGSENILTHDFQLKSSVQQLETVTVTATVSKPERDPTMGIGIEPGESAKRVDGVTGSIAPGSQGNFAAIAATVPGVTLTPGGVSVLGLGPGQNSTTLNGMAFSGSDIPRNVRTYSRVSGSSYDPSRGWFSGAQINVDIAPGFLFTTTPATLTVDAPALQYTDRSANALGQRFSNLIAGLGNSGSFALDRMNYSYGIEAGHRGSSFASLEGADTELLRQAGLARDSVVRLLGLMSAAGLPVSGEGLVARNSDYVSFIGRIDRRTQNPTTFNPEKQTWGILGYARVARSSRVGVTPFAPALHGGVGSQQAFSVQALYSNYLRDFRYLTEARSAFSVNRDRSDPQLSIPQGLILVSSEFPDAAPTVASVFVGGNSSLAQDSREWTWETSSVTRFYTSARSKHRVQLTATSRIDGFDRSTGSNVDGTFSFNSLADFAANAPSAFTRTLFAPRSSAKEWNAFASIGDYWRKSSTLQLLYGARLEANRFLDRPAHNPEIERIFGVRTDRAPAGFHASPRLGFTWIRVPAGYGIRFSSVGTFNMGPPSYLRGGIGEFRSLLPPSILSQAMIATGLPGGSARITCIGPAAPAPNWAAYQLDPAAIPGQCLTRPGVPAPFADAAPAVQLFDPSYQPPRSWRANLSYASTLGPLTYSVEGIYSLNLNQPGRTDLNFDEVTRFTTGVEGRPVFVNPVSVVPASGLVSTVDARRSATFGSVSSNSSDLQSITRQATIVVSPRLDRISGWFLSTAYTLTSHKALAGGFDAPTFDSPLTRTWARGELVPRHQFILQAGKTVKGFTFTLFGPIQSGLPFTPLISSDVNGDGRMNDRAYLFLPGVAGNAALDVGLRDLKAGSSRSIRNCLDRQAGRPAARNSCEGPWTANIHAQITKQFGGQSFLARRGTIALAIANPLGGVDQLLHGSRNLRGWGSASFPDPVLYNVRGFDPATNRFDYEVNPRFGSTRDARTARSPFRVTLDVTMNIAPPLAMQQIDRWLGAGRGKRPGPRLTADELKRRFSRNVPDPYRAILLESDSLLLSAAQDSAIQAAQAAYLRAVDTIWTPLTIYLSGLPQNFDAMDAAKRQEEAVDAAWELTRVDLQRMLPGILSPVQLTMLPRNVGYLFRSKERVRIRMFMSG